LIEEMKMKFRLMLAVCAALFAWAGASAQATQGSPSASAATAAAPLSEGEVRKVDLAQGKVILRHGPLVNLDMPGMTMVFSVPDRKLLEGLKVGDKVRFTAENKDGVYTVITLQLAQ